MLWVPADGSAPPSILVNRVKGPMSSTSLSSDGKLLLGFYPSERSLWVLPIPDGSAASSQPQPFLDSRSARQFPQFSRDGQWVAYSGGDRAGSGGVYVVPYPGPGGRIAISTEGGSRPRWGGRELFYRDGDQMIAVEIQTSPAFRAGTPKMLFQGRYNFSYDVTPDGQRFLMVKRPLVQRGPAVQLNVVLNWSEELRRRVPVRN
jgi:Tol biopolymer transport system component